MKILIVTPTFPPIGGAHTLRMIKMANALAGHGHEVHVLTYKDDKNHPTYDAALISRVSRGIISHGAPIGIWHRKVYNQNVEIKKEANYNRSGKNSVKKKINSIINGAGKKFARNFIFPDSMVDWCFSAVKQERKDKLVSIITPNVIISCSMPNSVHLIGYKLSKKYRIPLVVDYADPWVYSVGYKKNLRFYLERKLEKMILKHAMFISFSAEGCRKVYLEGYELDELKTITVMSGYEESLQKEADEIRKMHTKHSCKKLIYGGAIQLGVRDIAPLFQALTEIKDSGIKLLIRTDLLGRPREQVKKYGLESIVSIENYIPFDEHVKEIVESSVVVLLGNSNNIQIPSKVFNYMAIGTPILYLSMLKKEDDVGDMILNSKTGIVAQNNKEAILKALNKLFGLDNSCNTTNCKGSFVIKDIKRQLGYVEGNDFKQYSDTVQFGLFCKKLEAAIKNMDC